MFATSNIAGIPADQDQRWQAVVPRCTLSSLAATRILRRWSSRSSASSKRRRSASTRRSTCAVPPSAESLAGAAGDPRKFQG